MIRGQVWLAFGAIDQQRIDLLVLWNLQLCVRGKACATEADDAGGLDGLDDLFCGRSRCLQRPTFERFLR